MRLAFAALSSWLEREAVIVTPTSLLAGAGIEQISRQRRKAGAETWEHPSIFGFGSWLESGWREARYASPDVPTLLSNAQERALWRRIIEQERPDLFDLAGTVRLAQRAAQLAADWQISAEGDSWLDQADAAQFKQWHNLFQRQCRTNGWVTRSALPRLLPGWTSRGLVKPRLTLFLGFESTPSLDTLQRGMSPFVERAAFDPASVKSLAQSKKCANEREELELAARHARQLLEANPECSIALCVPDLAVRAHLVERTLRGVFFPGLSAALPSPEGLRAPYYLAQGLSLAAHPLISSALLLLKLSLARIETVDAGAILRSPSIANAKAERNERALADMGLRKLRELDVTLADIENAARNCPLLAQCWPKLKRVLASDEHERPLSAWAEFIGRLLEAMGWPGDDLTPADHDIVDRWKTQLSSLSSLGLVTPPVSLDVAIWYLRGLLTRPVPLGDEAAALWVLNSTAVEGLRFDHAIATGLSDECWPPQMARYPLVPLAVQRAHGVPGATMQATRELRHSVTKTLFQLAPKTLAAYTGNLSPLAVEFVAAKEKTVKRWEGLLPRDSFRPESLEQLIDSKAPRFVASGHAVGGSRIIRSQSQCPFRAFAEHRLRAEGPEEARFGFNAMERGGYLHEALQTVWTRLGSSDRLKETSPEELKELVRESVEAVRFDESGPLHKLSAETERVRLCELILDWLECERCRAMPFVVEKLEDDWTFQPAPGLNLRLRVDRVDRLKNGNLVLIDYKSGKVTRPKLDGPRPEEPQLLVYAAALGQQVDGIFFGQLRAGDVRAVGYSRQKHFTHRSTTNRKDWDEYIAESADIVRQLATDFVNGEAAVDHIRGACTYCGVKPMCRVNEAGATEEEGE